MNGIVRVRDVTLGRSQVTTLLSDLEHQPAEAAAAATPQDVAEKEKEEGLQVLALFFAASAYF